MQMPSGGGVHSIIFAPPLTSGLTQAIELTIRRISDYHHAVKMHKMLVEAVGIPALQLHMELLLRLMDSASTWPEFMFDVNRALPKVRRHLPPPSKGGPPGQGEFDL